ncbi:AAA family ATPase [Rubritalea sp.]|uniref:AAA family ATPase n=1 Tax=Rubritalea sp. TaxID=2109375 RepID=UPI003EF55BB5
MQNSSQGNAHAKRGKRRYRITRDVIAGWTKNESDRNRSLIFWLHDYASSHDLGHEEIGERLKQPANGKPYSADSVYQALTGRRDAGALENFLLAVEELQKIERERATVTKSGFIETNLTKKIFSICDSARTFNKVMFIIGESQIGKTEALKEYARRNNHGATVYIRCPAGGSKTTFVNRIAHILHLPTGGTITKLSEKVINAFDERMVLIVDEVHQMLDSKTGIRTLEYIREIADTSSCGLILAATPVYNQASKAAEVEGILRQLELRSLIKATLPRRPTKQNLNCFAKHFGLAPATEEALDLQTEIIEQDGLGRWISILEGASRMAAKVKKIMDWDHVLNAHSALLNLEEGI